MRLLLGDCLERMKELPDNSVDSIVTDPPYGLSFMGKKWDYDVPSVDIWREALRVLKPGGHLLSFAGSRTYHRMTVNIEDAGFEIRDQIMWVYGSGFPKSLNIGKAVDKLQGNEREVIGTERIDVGMQSGSMHSGRSVNVIEREKTKGTTDWEGWGTALKPAHEPICVARKPLGEATVASNVLKWGTGGINIDGCRVGTSDKPKGSGNAEKNSSTPLKRGIKIGNGGNITPDAGRFPANFIHDGSEEVTDLFPETKSGAHKAGQPRNAESKSSYILPGVTTYNDDGSSGSAARFFYCAKASKADRDEGLHGTLTVKYTGGICEENTVAVQLLEKVISDSGLLSFSIGESGGSITAQCQQDSLSTILTEINRIIGLRIYSSLTLSLTSDSTEGASLEMESGGSLAESVTDLRRWLLTITNGQMELARGASRVVSEMLSLISVEESWKERGNIHSTVKPTALMRYLCKLVTPKGGTVLDPFMGSGSTGKAAKLEGFDFVGIEMDAEYMKIAEARIGNAIVKSTLL